MYQVTAMMEARKDFALQEHPGIIWKVTINEGGRGFSSIEPMAIMEPTEKETIPFEATDPVPTSVSGQEIREKIFREIQEPKEGQSKESKILCLDDLVTADEFVPIIQLKK
ncbi:unnamed protein product [Orchesella dallaii]|uniref:Uncharacterized protein n=1 Tax=Orchesella dallaii TaxID=48710 RepID=A0ABP1Q0A7_9HEXA